MKKTPNEFPKFTQNEVGEKIDVFKALTEAEEAYIITSVIKKIHHEKKIPFHEIAVLYRVNAQSRSLEDSFRRMNIPYKIYGGTSFYQRKEIKDVLAYVRLCLNTQDNEALKRIINFPARGIGDTTLTKIEKYAVENLLSLWEALNQTEQIADLNNSSRKKIKDFVYLIKNLQEKITTLTAFDFINHLVIDSGIKEALEKEKEKDSIERLYNVQELISSIKEFEEEFEENYEMQPTIADFLEHVSLLTTLDENQKDEKNTSKVTLMTVHSAKGLEFDVVFIAGAEKYKFPLRNFKTLEDNTEEERRLFYVALTRARKKAFITFPEQTNLWGNANATSPSPFISEINPEYLNIPFELKENENNYNERRTISNQNIKSPIKIHTNEKNYVPLSEVLNKTSSTVPANFSHFKEGSMVQHERFGQGTIVKIEGDGQNTRALVDFGVNGQKQLLLKYAKLTLIN